MQGDKGVAMLSGAPFQQLPVTPPTLKGAEDEVLAHPGRCPVEIVFMAGQFNPAAEGFSLSPRSEAEDGKPAAPFRSHAGMPVQGRMAAAGRCFY
jgi:hypothetical protein